MKAIETHKKKVEELREHDKNYTGPTCAESGCEMRTLTPSQYCFAHILNDPQQVLFGGCTRILACKVVIGHMFS